MKSRIITPLVVLSIVATSISVTAAEPQLVIGKTVATPRIITVCAEATSTASGQLLRDTLARITDATSTKPYIIRLEPGYYAMGSTGLQMKPWVTIVGSGQNNTRITGTSTSGSSGAVLAASYSELRDLAVYNTNNRGGSAIAVYANSVTSFSLTRVSLFAAAASSTNRGLHLEDATAEATNCFIQATIHKSEGGYSYCIYNSNSNLTVRDTTLKAFAQGSGKARGLFNVGSSPALHHVVIESSWQNDDAAGEACGIRNHGGSNPSLHNTLVTAWADTKNSAVRAVGIDSYTGSNPIVTGGEIAAYADREASAVGIRSRNGSDPWLHSTTVRAESYNGSAYAIYNTQASTGDPAGKVTANNSCLIAKVTGGKAGNQIALFNNTLYTANFGSCLLDGGVSGAGSINCQACFDGNYDPLNDSCL